MSVCMCDYNKRGLEGGGIQIPSRVAMCNGATKILRLRSAAGSDGVSEGSFKGGRGYAHKMSRDSGEV